MRKITILLLVTVFCIIAAGITMAGCSNSTDIIGSAPEIDPRFDILTFKNGSPWKTVEFTHIQHAVYWDNNCLECHSHLDVRDDTVWGCESCHAKNDTESLCEDDPYGHDCKFVQCQICHDEQPVDPTPMCVNCHAGLEQGQFVFGAAEGLEFATDTHFSNTSVSGIFTYPEGEVITFRIGDIVLGSSTAAKGSIYLFDIFPGPRAADDQEIVNLCRLLMTLDENGDISDGIVIPALALTLASALTVDFDQSDAAFAADADVVALIDGLNSAGVFTDGFHGLVTFAAAQAEFQPLYDLFYPASTRIEGIPNTNFILSGIYDPGTAQSFTYKWYRADDTDGTNSVEISGADLDYYSPVAADAGKYILFEVTPIANIPTMSTAVGPVSSASNFTYYGQIGLQNEVDAFRFNLDTTTTVTMDILSVEDDYWYPMYHNSSSCTACHISPDPNAYISSHYESAYCTSASCHTTYFDEGGSTDLLLPNGSSNGSSNDWLTLNAYLFDSTDTAVESRDCYPVGCGTSSCSPGCLAPGAWTTRNGRNPYISRSLSAGVYDLRIGAAPMTDTDAINGDNKGGGYFNVAVGEKLGTYVTAISPSYLSYYKIVFDFQ